MNPISMILNFIQSIRKKSLKREEAELVGFITRLERELAPDYVDEDVTIDKMNVLADLKCKLKLVQDQLNKIG